MFFLGGWGVVKEILFGRNLRPCRTGKKILRTTLKDKPECLEKNVENVNLLLSAVKSRV